MTLSIREGVAIGPTLLRVLVDIYTQAEAHSPEEERKFVELAGDLLGQVDEPTLATVRMRLDNYPATPAEIREKLNLLRFSR